MANKPTYEELEQKVRNLVQLLKKCEQAEDALSESEKEYRNLFNSLPDPVIIIKQDYSADVNAAYTQISGYSQEETAKGLPVFETIIGEDESIIRDRIEARLAGRKLIPDLYSFELISKEGRHIPCESKGTLIQYKGAPAILLAIRDTTERKKTEEKLQKSEEQLRLAMEASRDGLWDWNIKENKVFPSPRLKEMLGYEKDEQTPVSMDEWVSKIHPNQGDRFSQFEKSLNETTSFSQDYLLLNKNGEYRWFNSRCIVLLDEKGIPYRMVGSTRDIDKEKKAEELIRKLTQSLITSQESERQMISRELHDSVAQDISSSKIACDMLLKYKSLPTGARTKILEVSTNLRKTLKSVRDLSYELRPPGLEKLGLVNTIHNLLNDFSKQTGVPVDFQSAGVDNLDLDYHTKINLYRLIQEGLNNVRKHADANNVKIRLVSSFPNIILRINDDGKGFDLKERQFTISREKRMGLRSMKERVDLLQGRINIESAPGKGTKVVVEIPHKDENFVA